MCMYFPSKFDGGWTEAWKFPAFLQVLVLTLIKKVDPHPQALRDTGYSITAGKKRRVLLIVRSRTRLPSPTEPLRTTSNSRQAKTSLEL